MGQKRKGSSGANLVRLAFNSGHRVCALVRHAPGYLRPDVFREHEFQIKHNRYFRSEVANHRVRATVSPRLGRGRPNSNQRNWGGPACEIVVKRYLPIPSITCQYRRRPPATEINRACDRPYDGHERLGAVCLRAVAPAVVSAAGRSISIS